MDIGEIMTTDVVTCSPDETLAQVAQKMQRENIGLCPVIDQDNLIGVITDRDITTRAVAKGFDPNSKHVHDFMTPSPITGDPAMSLEEACRLMANNQIRRLPVLEDNKLVGMVALADLSIDLEEDELLAETLMKISEPSR